MIKSDKKTLNKSKYTSIKISRGQNVINSIQDHKGYIYIGTSFYLRE